MTNKLSNLNPIHLKILVLIIYETNECRLLKLVQRPGNPDLCRPAIILSKYSNKKFTNVKIKLTNLQPDLLKTPYT